MDLFFSTDVHETLVGRLYNSTRKTPNEQEVINFTDVSTRKSMSIFHWSWFISSRL